MMRIMYILVPLQPVRSGPVCSQSGRLGSECSPSKNSCELSERLQLHSLPVESEFKPRSEKTRKLGFQPALGGSSFIPTQTERLTLEESQNETERRSCRCNRFAPRMTS